MMLGDRVGVDDVGDDRAVREFVGVIWGRRCATG
jgi:hypothetical protein